MHPCNRHANASSAILPASSNPMLMSNVARTGTTMAVRSMTGAGPAEIASSPQ